MKDAEDEAFEDIERRQGGFKAKRQMAADKAQDETDMLTIAYLDGYERGKKEALAQPAQQEAIYGMNQDDWKDVVAAIAKVRDGRGIYLGCRPADVFQEWFLALGTAKVKDKNR